MKVVTCRAKCFCTEFKEVNPERRYSLSAS